MNKDLKDLSFNELAKYFPITEGVEVRERGNEKILVPYKEIWSAQYEMPNIDFSTVTPDTIANPHRVEMRIRIYEED